MMAGRYCFDNRLTTPRSHGLVVRAVACEARGPGFVSSSDRMYFFSPRVKGGRNKMDPDKTKSEILLFDVDKEIL